MKKISAVSMLHDIRLVYRSALFVLLTVSYISYRMNERGRLDLAGKKPALITLIRVLFAL